MNGLAGELGHLHVDEKTIDEIDDGSTNGLAPIEYERWRCSCGRKHHLEAFASAPALVGRLEASAFGVPGDGPSQERLLSRARQGLVEDPLRSEQALTLGASSITPWRDRSRC
jgi:predicted NBD/HSP70 family sugar kinase